MAKGPKLWRKKNSAEGIGITPHRPQLDPGEIYLLGCTFKYVYDLPGSLLLELDSVCNFLGLFTHNELKSIPPEHLRRIEYPISKVLPPTQRFYIVKDGIRRLGNRAIRNRKHKVDVLKLYETYKEKP